MAESMSLLCEKPLRPVIGAVQLLTGQDGVGGNVDVHHRSLRQLLRAVFSPHGTAVLKLQRPQPEQQAPGLPPGPESPVEGPPSGHFVGLHQKAPEAAHRVQKNLIRNIPLPVCPPCAARARQRRRQLSHAAVLFPGGEPGRDVPPGALCRLR